MPASGAVNCEAILDELKVLVGEELKVMWRCSAAVGF